MTPRVSTAKAVELSDALAIIQPAVFRPNTLRDESLFRKYNIDIFPQLWDKERCFSTTNVIGEAVYLNQKLGVKNLYILSNSKNQAMPISEYSSERTPQYSKRRT